MGEILKEEFLTPWRLTQKKLADLTGYSRQQINDLCSNRRRLVVDSALILARVFGNTPDFWLNVQRRGDLWDARHSPQRIERILRAKPLRTAESS